MNKATNVESKLYTDSLFPEFEKYKELLTQKDVRIITLADAIKHIDRRAVSFYYSQNPSKQRQKNSKESIIKDVSVKDVIYSVNHQSLYEEEIIVNTFKEILQIIINDVESLLSIWDKNEENRNQVLALNLVDSIENDIKEKQEQYTPQKIDNYYDEVVDLASKLQKTQFTNSILINLSEFGKFSTSDITDFMTRVKNSIVDFSKDNVELSWAMGLILLLNISYQYQDYVDGHFGTVNDLVTKESQKSGENEGERKYKTIQEVIYPILAKGVHELNKKGAQIDDNDWGNETFKMGKSFNLGYCVEINEDNQDSDGASGISDRNGQCAITTKKIAELGLGNSRTFLGDIINHPETIKIIKQMSEMQKY